MKSILCYLDASNNFEQFFGMITIVIFRQTVDTGPALLIVENDQPRYAEDSITIIQLYGKCIKLVF